MITRKGLAGVGALALLAASGCQKYPAPSEGAGTSAPAAGGSVAAAEKLPFDQVVLNESAAVETPDGFPQWAFPGPLLKSLKGSSVKLSDVIMFDRTQAVDWYPGGHPPMPDVVKGRPATYACGFCHLPQGAGRSENAALAGLPAAYIEEQVHAFNSGERKTPDRKFGAAVNMEKTAAQASDADIAAAANYFSSLKYIKRLKLVESDTVPHFRSNAFVYVIDKGGPRQPLGQRIIEGPDDFELFEMRDPAMTFTAYVPSGAVARGAALAQGNGADRPACQTCHGVGLKGSEIGPPIAGRLPTSMFRQIYAIKTGTRHNEKAKLMQPVAAKLSNKEILELAAYVASLEP